MKTYRILFNFIIVFSIFLLVFCSNDNQNKKLKKIQTTIKNKYKINGDIIYKVENNFLVVNRNSKKLFLLNKNKVIVDSLGSSGKAPGEFLDFTEVTTNHNGYIAIYDYANGRINLIQIRNMKLKLLKTKIYDNFIRGMAMDNKNNIFIAIFPNQQKFKFINKLDINLNLIDSYVNKECEKNANVAKITTQFDVNLKIKNNILYIVYEFIPKIEKYEITKNKLIPQFNKSLDTKKYKPITEALFDGGAFRGWGINSCNITADYIFIPCPDPNRKMEGDYGKGYLLFDLYGNYLDEINIVNASENGSIKNFIISDDFKEIIYIKDKILYELDILKNRKVL